METLVSILTFFVGLIIVIITLASAIRTFVLPRSAPDPIVRPLFVQTRKLFNVIGTLMTTYEQRDSMMALYAPITLLLLLVVWLALIILGYTFMFRADGISDWLIAFKTSGSSVFTLGFAPVDDLSATLLSFSEAAIGLILVA